MNEILDSINQLNNRLFDFSNVLEAFPMSLDIQNLNSYINALKLRISKEKVFSQIKSLEQEKDAGPILIYLYPSAKAKIVAYFAEVNRLETIINKLKQQISPAYSRSFISGDMGFSWPWSQPTDINASDRADGLEVLRSFYDKMVSLGGTKFPSYDDFIAELDSKGGEYVETVGSVIRVNSQNVDKDSAKTQLDRMATSLNGSMPNNYSTFIQAAGQPVSELGWLTNVKPFVDNVLTPIFNAESDLASGALAAVSNTGTVLKYLPFLLVGIAGLAAYSFSKAYGSKL